MGDKQSSQNKKPGFFKKLFSSKPRDGEASENEKFQRPGTTSSSSQTDEGLEASAAEAGGKIKTKAAGAGEAEDGGGGGHGGSKPNKTMAVPSVKVDPPSEEERRSPTKKSPSATTRRQSASVDKGQKGKPPPRSKKPQQVRGQRSAGASSGGASKQQRQLSRKKKRTSAKGDVAPADPNQRLEFPTTPEMILAIHKRKPFLDKNEEWLVVELNEYECLVENLDIIKTIANHSKFFEVEPDELWEEFFEFVEEMPSYDEVINYDVWQEFRDERYPC